MRVLVGVMLGLGLLAFGGWQARRVLPVNGSPEEKPAVIAALPPDVGYSHTTSNGYVISLTLTVTSCSAPVQGFVSVVLPTQYYRAESDGLTSLGRPLFGFATDDPTVRIQYIAQSDWGINPAARGYRSWQQTFDQSIRRPRHREGRARQAR